MNTTKLDFQATKTARTNATERSPARLNETVRQERGRLLRFIEGRLPDPDEAEDVLQDVFMELTEAFGLAKPIEQIGAWLYAVARNKISDWYRKRRPNGLITRSIDAPTATTNNEDDEAPVLADWLAAADADSPDGMMFRETIMDAIAEALDELPADQREVFVRHELEGDSFKAMAAEWNVPVNTLLARKRYAVMHLRERLRDLYNELID
jgi:RNA polymerase sigma factor (sigma-70 family)